MRVIIGEAPSFQGDGTPFTGPSGRRLCDLLGVPDMDALRQIFELDNIFHHHAPLWDAFDRRHAQQIAQGKMNSYLTETSSVEVIMCGKKVAQAFGHPYDIFRRIQDRNVSLWSFPHPSGLNHFWNDPVNVAQAGHFLKMRAELPPHHLAGEHIPIAQAISEVSPSHTRMTR